VLWLNTSLYHNEFHRWVSKFLRTDYLYGFVFLRCSKVHKGCFKKVTWTIHHPLSGLSLAQKRSCLKTHWTMRNMALVLRHIFCSPATHRPSCNNRQPSLVAMAARAGLPFYCRSYWFRVVHHHEIDDNNKEESISSGNIIHILIALLLQICALLRYYAEYRANFFLCSCDRASCKQGKERDQQDATEHMFIINRLSQHVSGIIMSIVRRPRLFATTYGVQPWLCWPW